MQRRLGEIVKRIHMAFDAEFLLQIETAALECGMSRSEFIRRAVKKELRARQAEVKAA